MSYHTLEVDGSRSEGAAWSYRHPTPLARRIKNHVAFGPGVDIVLAEQQPGCFLRWSLRDGYRTPGPLTPGGPSGVSRLRDCCFSSRSGTSLGG